MFVDEASGRFLTQRAVAKMSQLSALWNAEGGLKLSAPEHAAIEIALPANDAELRGVTIWRDTLRVPDAGDEAARAWVSEFIGKPTRLVQVPLDRARTTQAGYGNDDDQVAFADGFPLLLIGEASLEDLCAKSRSAAGNAQISTESGDRRQLMHMPRMTGNAFASVTSSSV
jgi:uncharacterized protein YcbX